MARGVEWRAIPGDEAYHVSRHGDVKRAIAGRATWVGRVLRHLTAGSGYKVVSLVRDGKGRHVYVHRLVMLAFVGPPPSGHEVNHIDGDKTNNALSNLEYVTRAQNCRHAFDNGLARSGADHHWWSGGPKPKVRKPPHAGSRHWTALKPELIARGDTSGRNKISSADVASIRDAVAKGAVQKQLAHQFGISTAQVSRIVNGTRWTHVET